MTAPVYGAARTPSPEIAGTLPREGERWRCISPRASKGRIARISSTVLLSSVRPRVEYRFTEPTPDTFRSPSRARTNPGRARTYVQTVCIPLDDFLRRFERAVEAA